MKDYRKRVEKMKQRFQREEKRRRKKQLKAQAAALEADDGFDLLEMSRQPTSAAQEAVAQEGDCEHLFDVFRRLFEEKLELYVDRETKYQDKRETMDEA